MDFEFSKHQKMIQKEVRRFAQEELAQGIRSGTGRDGTPGSWSKKWVNWDSSAYR